MADRFLHGIELIEIEDGGRTVRTVKSSVIGLVGTAPDAAPARHATLTVGTGDASFTVRAKAAGIVGNSLRLELRPATPPNQPLAITLDTRTPGMTLILVTLASDATGQRASTAAEVVAALNAHEAAGKASKLKALEQIPAALEKQLTDNLMLMSELGAQATPAIFYLDDNDRLQQHQGAPRPEALETILGPR